MASKKRKNPADSAQAAASPVSAVAARRRLADPATTEDDPEEAVAHSLTPSNAFSALRGMKRIDNSSPTALKKSYSSLSKTGGGEPGDVESTRIGLKSEDSLSKVSAPRIVTQYSSFALSKRNSRPLPDSGLELRLQDGERFMVTGTFGVKVLTGHITVQGANLRPSQVIHWVHASYVHAVPVIRTHQETCLQLLSDKRSDGLRSMGQLSPLYAQLWLRGGDDPSSLQTGRTFDILFSSDDNPKRGLVQELVSPPVWNKKLAGLVPQADKTPGFTVFICGPKSSGKSTMSRLLVNRLLTRGGSQIGESTSPNDRAVAVLDIDPGQPEYGPPGTLSLVQVRKPNLASPFSHPGLSDDSYTVFQSHALAAVSPAANPALYRQCAVALYATYRQRMPECPLIVNTPGWIQGTGLELLTDLIKELNPHETLYMSEEGPAESVDALQEAGTQEFTTLPSQPSEMTFRTAAELREMQTMSYFHGHQSDLGVSWDHRPLSHSKPCVIPYSGQSSILGILCYDYQAPPSLLSDSINGMVLAMVGIERPAAFGCLLPSPSSRRPQIENTPEGLPYISNPKDVALDPRHSTLLGLVLIRGIDIKKRALLGLSPVLGENKDTMNAYAGDIVLIHGNFGCPNWAYTEMLYYSQARGRVVDQKQTTHNDMTATSTVPWVEVLEGNQSRPVGSRRWRVRRDLGRGG